ncbi:MAG: hypothetical protein ABI216_20995 [Devosia sp.]
MSSSRVAAWILAGSVALFAGSAAGANSVPLLTDRSSFSELLASLTPATSPTDLSKTQASSKVTFVHVADMPGYTKDGLQLSSAARKTMHEMEARIYRSTALLGHLIDAGYSITDVIALSADARGDVTVFIAK